MDYIDEIKKLVENMQASAERKAIERITQWLYDAGFTRASEALGQEFEIERSE